MTAGVDPVGQAGIGVGGDDADATVRGLYGRVLVECNIEIRVIKRLHPGTVELEIPRVARWRREGDDQRLLRAELPIAVVIQDAGIAAGSIGNGGIEKRQLIRMLPESV